MTSGQRGFTSELDERIIEAIREAPMPVVNTQYLTAAVGESDDQVVERLEHLVQEGIVDHLEVEGRGHLWWLTLPYEPGG